MYKIFICLRYLRARLITYLATLLVAIGVMVFVVVISVMGGFQKQFKERVRGTLSDLSLERRGPKGQSSDLSVERRKSKAEYEDLERVLRENEHVKDVSPRMKGLCLVGSQEKYEAAQIYGIDVEQEYKVGKLEDYLLTKLDYVRLDLEEIFKARNFNLELVLLGWRPSAETQGDLDVFLEENVEGVYPSGGTARASSGATRVPVKRGITLRRVGEDGELRVVNEWRWRDLPAANPEPCEGLDEFVSRFEGAYNTRRPKEVVAFYEKDAFNEGGLDLADPFKRPKHLVVEGTYRPILVGIDLFRQFALYSHPEIGLTTGYIDEKGEVQAHKYQFQVVGAFKTGMVEWDKSVIYGRLDDVKDFVRREKVDEVAVRLDDYRNAEDVKYELAGEIPGWTVQTWEDQRRPLLRAVELEKVVMGIILSMIVLLAVVTIMVVLILLVHEKTKDIGILRSLGATRWGIIQIILTNGFVIGLVGSVVGVSLGVTFVLNINGVEDKIYDATGFRLYPRDVYYLDKIPDEVDPTDVMATIVVTLGLCLALGFYPALLAARLDPVEAFRRE